MAQVGRNERCPCGSGKKFKHCCLLVQIQPSYEVLTARRLGRLADWIAAKFRSQIPAQADEFFFEFDAEERELLNSGKHAGANGVSMLVTDYICIDGVFELRGVQQTGLEWFLDASGPLSSADREFYEALACSGLRAYRVVAVNPGEGMDLLDLFEPEIGTAFVHEKFGSTQVAVNDVIGARVIAADGVIQFAAMVPFHPEDGDALMENYIEDLALARAQVGLSGEGEGEDEDEDEDVESEAELDAAIAQYALEHQAEHEAAEGVEHDLQDDFPAEAEDDANDEMGAEAHTDADGDDEDFDDNEFDEDSVRDLVKEMTLQDMVAARVVSTYWLESVLDSLRPPTVESAADE